ncbi:MAG: hypothetical protein HY910_07390 [Desulfarculus sp.]|nr:hypothetical protein [Desulfarculus sp.]
MASRIEIELGARDSSGPVLNQFGANVRRTFDQAGQDAARASQSTSLLDRSLGGLAETVRAVGLAFGAYELGRYVKDAALLAARYETLGVTLKQLGSNVGYSQGYLDLQEQTLRKAGISALGARESLARMIQANLDLGKSAQLARVAQDAAAISGLNSSEAYKTLVYGIQSAQVEMLRTVGINVSFEQSYAAVAAQTGRAAESLTEVEKAQIRLNAVLAAGKSIAGSYEAAMTTAGKQILSFQRYAEDLQVELGKAFGPALTSIVSQAVESIGSLSKSVTESASSGALKSMGDSLQWVAEHGTLVVASMTAVGAVMAAVKAEAWLLDGGLGRLVSSLEATSKAAGFTLRNAFAAHPLVTAAAGVALLATGLTFLADRLGWTDEAMRRQAETANRASREFATLNDTVNGVSGPLQQYQESLARANGDQQKQLEALQALRSVFPELTGDYHSLAEGLANVNLNLEKFLALKRAELELLKDKAEAEQSKRLANLVRQYQEAAQVLANSRRSMTAAFQRNQAAANDGVWEEDKKLAESMRELYVEASRLAYVKGISPELRDSAEDLKGKVLGLLKELPGFEAALKKLGLAGQQIVAPMPPQPLFPQLSLGDKKAVEEIDKLRNEAKKALLHPTQARLFDINQEVINRTAELWTSNPSAEVARAGTAQIEAWGNAQRAALAPEIAKTKADWVRGLYEIGGASREQLLANLQAEAGVYVAGGERTRSQYLQTQKAITDITLQGYRDRESITEASFNLGRQGQSALVAAYQAELAILPALKMSTEDRAKRELELAAKIRDVKEQSFTRELDLEKQRVSWMAEGTAKTKAQLDIQEAEERHHLQVLFAANKDLQDRKKALLDDYDKYAQRRREEAESKERQQALNVQLQTAKIAGNTRLAKELELRLYVESLKTSGIDQIYHEQLIANKRVELYRTSFEQTLLSWRDFGEGWDKIFENTLSGIQSNLVSAFQSAFADVSKAWESLWEAGKNIALQALGAIATRLVTYGLAHLLLSFSPALGGALGNMAGANAANGNDGAGGLLGMASKAKGAYDLYGWLSGGPGFSTFGMPGGFGSSLFNWTGGTGDWASAFMTPEISGLSTLGYGVAGVGGALSGWQLARLLYGGKGNSGIGGAVGGAAGGIGGGYLASLIGGAAGGPIGLAIGALAGGLLGGAGGGFLGSLFGGEDDSPAWAKPGNPQAHWDELNRRLDDYGKRLKSAKLSQEDFCASLGELAPLAAGAGQYLGGYGQIIGGTLTALQGLTQGTQEYVDKLNTELNPAWIISTGLAQNLAAGMDKLEAHKKALSDSIDALAASSGSSPEQQSQLVDLIIQQSGNVADLTAKYERYNEIKQQLMNANNLERGQVEALGAELRALHDELGIASNPMDNLTKVTSSLDQTMQGLERTMRAIFNLPSDKEFNITTNYRTNGSPAATAHTGSLVSAVLANNLITRHGGGPAPLYAHDGYPGWDPPKPGEVDIRALMGEWIIQPSAVDYYGNDFMAALNDRRIPVRPAAAPAVGASIMAQAGPSLVIQQLVIQVSGDSPDVENQGRQAAQGFRDELAAMHERGEMPGVAHSMAVSR